MKGTQFRFLAALAMVSTAALLSACGGDDKGTGETLATVNGSKIRESRVAEQMGQIPADLLKGREADVKRQILDRVIDQELVAQEAKKLDIEDDADYKKQLELVKLQLQANAVIARKVSETITAAVVQQRYDQIKNQLAFPAVKAKHILVPSEQEALDILKVVTPANFSEIAKARSKGPSANEGGDLGWFRREAMIPEFAQVAFATPVGQVAQTPVKTQFGWHVILVEARNDKYVPPVSQVEPQIRQELAQTIVQGYLGDLRKNATITYADQPKEEPKK